MLLYAVSFVEVCMICLPCLKRASFLADFLPVIVPVWGRVLFVCPYMYGNSY